jgi:hypothetical protein
VRRRGSLPLVLIVGVLVTGCAARAAYRPVGPERVGVGDAYTVDPQLGWTMVQGEGTLESWTVDGFLLHALRFFKGVADGQPLLVGGKDEDRRPRFRATMTETELAELVVDSLYGGRLRPQDLGPAPFGGAPGFRFELDYVRQDGLRRRALVAGAVLRSRLHLIVYDGTALHHFPRYREPVERLLASIQLR